MTEEYLYEQIEFIFNKYPNYRKRQIRNRSFFISAHFGKEVWCYDELDHEQKLHLLVLLTRYSATNEHKCCPEHNIGYREQLRERRRLRYFSVSTKLKKQIAEGTAICVKCGSKENLTIDHIVSIAKGGKTEEGNLQIMCAKCNEEKADKE
jgi:5-methylcytosine-specific restriction endonuclease McrA